MNPAQRRIPLRQLVLGEGRFVHLTLSQFTSTDQTLSSNFSLNSGVMWLPLWSLRVNVS